MRADETRTVAAWRERVSPEALAAWRACKQIKQRGSDEYRDAGDTAQPQRRAFKV
jgi:hypothetical protein